MNEHAYLPSADFEARMTALAGANPAICSVAQFPHQLEPDGGAPHSYSYLKLGRGGGPRTTALVVGGIHAREWAQPDALLVLAERLVDAYNAQTAFIVPAYGGFGPYTVPAPTVRKLIEALDVFLVPVANPDGRAFSLDFDPNLEHKNDPRAAWRKNRARRVDPNDERTIGVDLNRHFDIGWDFKKLYSPTANIDSSIEPKSDGYNGAKSGGPGSQPEARNLVWLLENQPITYVIDCHSAKRLVMYPWSIEQNGVDPDQNIWNKAFDGKRDGKPAVEGAPTTYREFFPNQPPERLRDRHEVIAKSIADAITAATGRSYGVGGAADGRLAIPGSFMDYAFSRHIHFGAPPTFAFGMEFGDDDAEHEGFWPTDDPNGYPLVEREIHAAVLAFLQAALSPAPLPNPKSSSCLFALAMGAIVAGSMWIGAVPTVRWALSSLAPTGTRRGGHSSPPETVATQVFRAVTGTYP